MLDSSLRPLRIPLVPLLAVALSLAGSAVARADGPPVMIWGFQRGCERMPDLDRKVEKQLYAQARDVALLRSPDGQPLPACGPGQAERCAATVRKACPGAQAGGRVLGGQVVTGRRDVLNVRLWLHDLATGQTAYQDDYCESCDIVTALSVQARHLINEPHFGGPAPDAKPLYCSAAASQGRPAAAKAGPVFLTVYGDGRHKPALLAALRAQLDAIGRTVLPVTVDSKNYSRDVLQKIVAGQQDAQVLMADVQRDSQVALFLFDQKSALTDGRTVTCGDCDRDTLFAQVKQSVADLLDHCFGAQCALTHAGSPPPADACEPYPESTCPGLDSLTSGGAAVAGGRYVDGGTAKLIKGSIWGLFAASSVTAIGLFAVSGTDAGTYRDTGGALIHNSLDRPAWALTGLSAAILAVAIPLTITVQKASRSPRAITEGAQTLQCPN